MLRMNTAGSVGAPRSLDSPSEQRTWGTGCWVRHGWQRVLRCFVLNQMAMTCDFLRPSCINNSVNRSQCPQQGFITWDLRLCSLVFTSSVLLALHTDTQLISGPDSNLFSISVIFSFYLTWPVLIQKGFRSVHILSLLSWRRIIEPSLQRKDIS